MSEIKPILCKSLLDAQQVIKDKKIKGEPEDIIIVPDYGLEQIIFSDKPDDQIEPEILLALRGIIRKRRDLIKKLLEE